MKTRQRKSSATRREEIARACLRIIGSRGLTKLTMTNIAEEIGLTSGALFRHFESRQQILGAAVEYGLAEIEKTFPNEELPPLERLKRLAINRIDLLSRQPGLAFLLRSEQALLVLPEHSVARLRDMVARSRVFLLETIREAALTGSIRNDIESELLLVPVMGTIHALIPRGGVRGEARRGTRERAEKVLEALMLLMAPPDSTNGPHDN